VIRASPIVQTGETGSVLHPGNVRCYVWNVLSLISRPVIYTTNIKFITKSALISGIKVTEDLKYKQPTMGVVLDRPCFLVPAAHLAHVSRFEAVQLPKDSLYPITFDSLLSNNI